MKNSLWVFYLTSKNDLVHVQSKTLMSSMVFTKRILTKNKRHNLNFLLSSKLHFNPILKSYVLYHGSCKLNNLYHKFLLFPPAL